MTHQADDLDRRSGQLREAPAAHAGVELEVHVHTRGELTRADDELEAGIARLADLTVAGGSHDDDARRRKVAPQLEGLGHGGDAESRRTGSERSSGDVCCPVAVPVGLDDRPELRTGE